MAVRNFGCRANQAEAFAWADAFRERGLRLDADWGRSDIVIVNSCALTGRAERDVRKFIRAVHRRNPGSRIVVTGCYAERAPEELAALPGVASVLPQSAKEGLADRLTGPSGAGVPEARVPLSQADGADQLRARAYLKIQDGCDIRCTYCVIPRVRGRSRSVHPDAVKASVVDLAARGFREIVLAGIHLSSYGEDLEPRTSLRELLRHLAGVSGPARLRLSSLDPRKTDRELVAFLAGDERIRPHFHLSLQHASPRVLRAMGRPVEPGSYDRILTELRRLAPDAALGADMIVGFPGETEADFEELEGFVERSPLTYVHVFSYSPRPGTPAADRPPIPAKLVTGRARALRRASALKDLRFRRRFLGRELEAVVINTSDGGAEVLTGNFIKVLAPSCREPRGGPVRVAIRRALAGRTEGEIVS